MRIVAATRPTRHTRFGRTHCPNSAATALDDPRTNDRFARQALPAHLLPQGPVLVPTSDLFRGSAALRPLPTTGFVGLGERLLRLPPRPVVLGETPRTPTDAEQSVGVVLRFPLSL